MRRLAPPARQVGAIPRGRFPLLVKAAGYGFLPPVTVLCSESGTGGTAMDVDHKHGGPRGATARQRIGFLAAALAAGLLEGFHPAAGEQKILRFSPQADLRILDPITTTAYITRNHGYMVYDTLFATDANFHIQPQMVDHWEVSGAKLQYTFTLRAGLKLHDGQPVRSADAIASIDRWSKRDVLGQKLAEATAAWTAVNDK